MELVTSPMQDEIDKIIKEGPQPVHHAWTVEFTIRKDCPIELSDDPDDVEYVPKKEEEKVYVPLKILNIDFVHDFEQSYGDEINLRCQIPFGLWAKVLYPCRDYLKATLIKSYLKEEDLSYDKEVDKESETFSCLPKITDENSLEGKRFNRYSRRELDTKEFLIVDFQLTDESLEKLRSVTFGGIWRRCTPEDLVKAVLANESKKVGGAIDFIDVKKASNEEPREHFMIPQQTPLTELARYVQVKCGGLYNTGVGQYMRNKTWYVYPLYDTTRFGKESRTLTIVRVPELKYTNSERTFREDGKKVYIIATSAAEFQDRKELKLLRDGNGVRFGDSRLYMNDLVETRDNKAIASRSKVNHEFVSEDRPKCQVVVQSPWKLHSNPYEETTKLARRAGATYIFEWEKSDPSLIIPGMMAKILFAKGDEVGELEGVVLKVQTPIQLLGQAVTAHGHKSTTVIHVFCNTTE